MTDTSNDRLEFLGRMLRHDMASPLHRSLSVGRLLSVNAEDPEQSELCSILENSLSEALETLNDVSHLLLNDSQELELEEVYLAPYLTSLGGAARNGRVNSTVELKLSLPEVVVKTDARRLRIIVKNLLCNAFRFNNSDRRKQWVEIGAEEEQDHVVIYVKDNGLGIPRGEKQKIFQPFYRAHHHKRGSGLGLYLVSELTKDLGGTVEVSSRKGRGSTFSVHLPKN